MRRGLPNIASAPHCECRHQAMAAPCERSCSCDLVADAGKEWVVAEDVVLADVAVPRANAIAATEFGLAVRTSHCRDPADEGEVARRSMLLYAHREIRSDPEHRRDNVDVVPRAADIANGTWPMANDVFRQDL
jgi:hypothetical protein